MIAGIIVIICFLPLLFISLWNMFWLIVEEIDNFIYNRKHKDDDHGGPWNMYY